jgi:hypothetical protein
VNGPQQINCSKLIAANELTMTYLLHEEADAAVAAMTRS